MKFLVDVIETAHLFQPFRCQPCRRGVKSLKPFQVRDRNLDKTLYK